MRRRDGKPTSALQEQAHELKGKSSRKMADPVSRRGGRDSDPLEETSNSYSQKVHNPNPLIEPIRGALPPPKWKKRTTELTGLCRWPGTTDPQGYRTLVDTAQ